MVLALALVPRSAAAEPWPLRSDPYVTDIAGVLPEDEESRLRAELAALRTETGVAMAVLTLRSRSDYDGSSTLAAFATGVFNAWGIGDGARNDGILVLVATEDRELRITLGAGYDQGYDVLAEDIAARHFLPDLRQGAAARSIMAGSREVMARIARPHAAALPAEALPSEGGGLPGWLPVALFAAGAGLLVFRRRLGDRAQVLRRCPSCGRFGLRRTREGLNGAAGETEGQATTRIACRRCGFHENRDPRIPRQGKRDEADGGGFGGGRSSGGGATGRW